MVKKLDGLVANAADDKAKRKAFVVLLTDDPEGASEELADFAKQHQIRNIPLTFYDGLLGPDNYRIARRAIVTVMMWEEDTVKINRTFARAELNDKSVKRLVSEARNFLSAKK